MSNVGLPWFEFGGDKSLLAFFNCYLKEEDIQNASNSKDQPVLKALQLSSTQWPREIVDCRLLDFQQLAVPLVPGLTPQDRAANALVILLVIVGGKCCFARGKVNSAWK